MPRLYLQLSVAPVTTFCAGFSLQLLYLWLPHSERSCASSFCPHQSVRDITTKSLNHLPGILGGNSNSACIHGPQQLSTKLPLQSYFPLLPACLPPTPHPHPCLCTQAFLPQMPPSSFCLATTKAQVRHVSSRKTAMATPGEHAPLILVLTW